MREFSRDRTCYAGALRQGQAPVTETEGTLMRLIIALILPWLTFFTIGRPLSGIICLILQITLIGWLPATIWAVYALSQFKTDQKIERAMRQQT
jgi:uncharacterized membrane protein YqaE (UPF0057 family)